MKKCLVVLVLLAGWVFADTPEDGLQLALHPDGNVIMAGGENRVIYTIDAETLDVTDRMYFGSTINRLMYSPDGSLLFVQDSEPDIYVLDANSLEITSTLGGYGSMSMAPAANLMVALNRDWDGDTITLFNTSGMEMQSVTYGEDDDVASIGISPDGTKLAVFFEEFESENEEDVSWGDIPEEYEGFEKDVYAERHDGEEARYILYSLPDFEVLADYISFFSPYDDELVLFQDDQALIINSSNENARYSLDGTVEMWEWSGGNNAYGVGYSKDHSILVTGSLADGVIVDFANNSDVSFDIDDLPGWPEYFSSFTVAEDGTVYGATDAFRIVKIQQAGAGVSKDIKAVY